MNTDTQTKTLKMKDVIVQKAYECTTSPSWWQINPHEYFYGVYHAENASKARMMALRDWEGVYKELLVSTRVRRRHDCDMVENFADPLSTQITKEMFDKAFHAIGRKAVNQPSRNRYISNTDDDFEKLIEIGLADKRETNSLIFPEQWMYFLTKKGIDVIVSMQPIERRNKQTGKTSA